MQTKMRSLNVFCLPLLSLIGLSWLGDGALATKTVVDKQPRLSAKTEQRHFQFPTSFVLGALQLLGNEESGTTSDSISIGKAQGNITVTVPPGRTILLELTPRSILHPELIKDLHTAGINRLKLAYLSMEDEGHSECDKALQALPEFKDIISLNVARSDVTDKGFAGFKSLPSVRYITAFGCALDGSIFKETQRLKSLRQIDLMFNPLKGVNFKTLGDLPQLEELNLNQTNISDDDMQYLPKCQKLRTLNLLENKRITDKSLPKIQQQTSLSCLDLRGTGVTLPGILTLKSLKLRKLVLTVRRYREDELAQLKKAFPGAVINFRGGRVNAEDQMLYAPLK